MMAVLVQVTNKPTESFNAAGRVQGVTHQESKSSSEETLLINIHTWHLAAQVCLELAVK